MVGIKEMLIRSLIPLLMVFSLAWGRFTREFYERSYNDPHPYDKQIQQFQKMRRAEDLLLPIVVETRKDDSGCNLSDAFGGSCDNLDAVKAGERFRFLQSPLSPGRRKRKTGFNPFLKSLNFDK